MDRHNIQFPKIDASHLDQDKAYFYLKTGNRRKRIKLHDYGKIYSFPGLYEQLYYDRLKCCSPQKVADVLQHTIEVNNDYFSTMKVLDFGAGNGMMGEELKKIGVARLVGVDIIDEAKIATERDRPGIYDEYYIKDFTNLDDNDIDDIRSWNLNAMVSVAALGFGDIPPRAFVQALNLIDKEGWVAFNIKETFLYNSDKTGFSKLIRELIFSEFLKINHLERYMHRLSLEGNPLYYFTVICWKVNDVPVEFLEKQDILPT